MKLSVGSSPHWITVVDTDVLSLLDVDGSPDHNPVVSIKVFAGIVDAGMLQDGNVGVQRLAWSGGHWNLMGIDIEDSTHVQYLLGGESCLWNLEKLPDNSNHCGYVSVISEKQKVFFSETLGWSRKV